MAAVEDPKTATLSLPLKVHGHVALQQAVKSGFQLIDSAYAALEARVTALETGLNDSNSQFFDGDPG